jgi:type I restriction enzyme S subunit
MREDWIEVELGEVCDINMGQSPPSSTYNSVGKGLPFFQGKAEFTDLYPVVRKWCTKPTRIANEGDILLSVRAPVGSTNIANQECAIGRGLAAVTYPFSNKVIWYYLKSIEQLLDKQGTGTTFRAVSGNIVRKQIFPLAPLPIQRAIVSKIEALFSDLDNGIANFKKAQAQLKIYRQAVLKKAFEGELTKVWREKNNISFNWEKTTTGEVMSNINSGSTPKAEFLFTSGEIQFLKVYNLNFDGTLNHQKDPAYTTYEIHSTANKRAICIAGDVLINIVGPPLGKVSVIPKNSKLEFSINQAIVRFRPNEKIISKFLSQFLQSPTITNWLEGTSKATAGQYNVKVSTCREIPISLPSIVEQTQIVQEIESRLSVCDKMEQSITESIAKAEALRQSILKKAFEGKLLSPAEIDLCKKEADYEPASVLLEKIKAEKLAKEQAQQKPISKIKK